MTTLPTQSEHAQPATILRERLSRIHDACMGMQPKQAVGEMIVAMIDMPEWAALTASPVAQAGQIVAWRVNSVHGNGGWIDGAPTESQIADFRDNAPGATLQYAYGKTEHIPAVVSTNEVESNMTGGADPTPDELRAIARKARDSSGSASDDCGPTAYVLYGWRAAMLKAPSIEDLCSRIKAADDSAADRDYMLDSNDCIAVLRGEWKGPLAMDKPDRAASHGQAPAGAADRYIDGVNIAQLREAPIFLGRRAEGQEAMAANLSEHINAVTRAVLSCKELLRPTAQAAPAAGAVAGPVYRIRNKKSASQIWTQVSESEYRNALTMPAQFECSQVAPTPAAQADSGVQEDAARYRWLRHGDNDEKVLCNGPVAKDYWYLLRGEKLDAAIDAALAAKGGK